MYELVIFDLDGTLVDSLADIHEALNLALREVGYPEHPPEAVARMLGEGVRELVGRALPEGTSDRQLDQVLERYRARYLAHSFDRSRLYPGVRETLDALHGLPLAVATNKLGEQARGILDGLQVRDRFFAVLGDGDVARRKPDPEILRALCGRAEIGPERTLYVGDSRVDAATARAAQIDFCLVSWGYEDPAVATQLPARWRIERMAELPALVRGGPARGR